MVMNDDALPVGKDINLRHGFPPTLAMNAIVGERIGRGDMQPLMLASNAQTAFIMMGDIGGDQLCSDGIQGRCGATLYGTIGFNHQRRRWRMVVEVAQQFAGSGHG